MSGKRIAGNSVTERWSDPGCVIFWSRCNKGPSWRTLFKTNLQWL